MRERQREMRNRLLLQVREDERKQVALELHDQIIQALIVLKNQIPLMRASAGSHANTYQMLVQMRIALRMILDDLQTICAGQPTPVFHTSEFIPAIQSYIQHVQKTNRLHISLQLEGGNNQPLSEDIAACLFRVLQETLANIQKHAAARQVVVRLSIHPHEVGVTIHDDGVGFLMPEHMNQLHAAQHFGLAGMHERLNQIQGRLVVLSALGRGTYVYAWAPRLQPGSASGRVHSMSGAHKSSRPSVLQEA